MHGAVGVVEVGLDGRREAASDVIAAPVLPFQLLGVAAFTEVIKVVRHDLEQEYQLVVERLDADGARTEQRDVVKDFGDVLHVDLVTESVQVDTCKAFFHGKLILRVNDRDICSVENSFRERLPIKGFLTGVSFFRPIKSFLMYTLF